MSLTTGLLVTALVGLGIEEVHRTIQFRDRGALPLANSANGQ